MKNVFKDKKFLLFLGIVFVVCILVMNIVVGGAPKRHNQSLKKDILKTVTTIADENGLENLNVVYVDDYNAKIVFECDKMSEIAYTKKVDFFIDALNEVTSKGDKYSFYENSKVAVYSDGNRYTVSGSTKETLKVYENGDELDPETNKIKVKVNSGESAGSVSSGSSSSSSSSSNKNNSSSSSSSTSKTSCKGGVGCRAGYHACNPHKETGYCRSCCKD